MPENADIILMGIGTCGEDLGLRLTGAGLKVIGIEPQLVGGECAYWACVPTKMMVRAANLLQEARRVDGFAGRATVTPDWAPVAKRIREAATGDWDDSLAVKRFSDSGGHFVRGWGRLTGPNSVTVGDQTYTAERGIVLATGSKPIIPPIHGLSEVDYWLTHDIIKAETLPRSLIILGGGAVGCEMAQVWARFGVDVTIIEGHDRLLPMEEPEASAVVARTFQAEGLTVHLGNRAEQVDMADGLVRVTLAGGEQPSAERILVATGRTVDTSSLGLEAAGLKASGPFVSVDGHMRAGDGVWAVGDITGKAMFTHVALYQGGVVAADILGQDHPPADYRAIPRITFTDPQVGAVGMREIDAREAGLDVVTTVKNVPATFRGWIDGGATDGVIKLIVDRSTGTLLGATSVGPSGGEVLGLLCAAVHQRMPLESLRHMIWPYPTFFGGIGEAIGAYGTGITRVFDPETDPLLKP